jgi:hypothetical protein
VSWFRSLGQLSGMQHGKDRVLGFDPCCVSYYNNGEYLIVSGSDKKATLMTKEGVKLSEIATQTDLVWSAKARPKQNYVAVACNDGTVGMHQLAFSTVHGLYQVRFCDFVHYCRCLEAMALVLMLFYRGVVCHGTGSLRVPRHHDGRDCATFDHGAEGAHQVPGLRQENRGVPVRVFPQGCFVL